MDLAAILDTLPAAMGILGAIVGAVIGWKLGLL